MHAQVNEARRRHGKKCTPHRGARRELARRCVVRNSMRRNLLISIGLIATLAASAPLAAVAP
jgi:hypothetical protein